MLSAEKALKTNLVLIQLLVDQFILTLLLEGDDDESDEDVDEEEGEDDEVDDVEDSHLHPVPRLGASVFKSGFDGVLEDPDDYDDDDDVDVDEKHDALWRYINPSDRSTAKTICTSINHSTTDK